MLHVEIRPADLDEKADGSFVRATWQNHLQASSEYGKGLPREVFFPSHRRTMEAILRRPTCRVLVGHPPSAMSTIAGFLVTDELAGIPTIHFGYVKGPFRSHGIMRQIWEASGLDGNECIWTQPTFAEEWVRAKFPKMEVLDFWR